MTTTATKFVGLAVSTLLAGLLSPAPATADDDPPMHQVVYTISAKNPIYADIYYQDQDPTKFSDYSHNPYTFTPNIQADIAPGRPWTQQVMLINPEAWAMVSVSTGRQPGTPGFHCTVSVDGNVVVSKDGDKGVLCSLRTW
ncbi:MAG: hypothetical protein CK431_28130 [Mycobacterium sp.]|nr:MAG: hypothetical protein CK431_28130 [Mycobacterium sp.]